MITRDAGAFFAAAQAIPADFGPATARAAFLVAPEGFGRAEESARDNRYMAAAAAFDPALALAEHRALQRRMSTALPTLCFAGDPATPDAVFPNNVFGTVDGRAIIGRMRHPVRQAEALRADIRGFLRDVLRYREIDLSTQSHPCELTGALVIDRARGLGFCGLSERCDAAGAQLMHEAFGLRATLLFDLAPGEYHTNVVLAVLAGRAALVCPQGFADPAVGDAIAGFYGAAGFRLDAAARDGFVANAIALTPASVWMSAAAGAALPDVVRAGLGTAGFAVETVPLAAIEAAGGSLRCCVAELY